MNEQRIWEKFVELETSVDGNVWVRGTRADLVAALGEDHGFHETSLHPDIVALEAIECVLPADAHKLRLLLGVER